MKLSIVVMGLAGLVTIVPAGATPTASLCDQVANNLVQNCGFEGGSFSPWVKTETLNDSVGLGVNFPHSGAIAANFSGANAPVEMLDQALSTIPGQSYTFSFFEGYAGGLNPSFFAKWDGITEFSITSPPTTNQYQFRSFSVIATSATTHIQFGLTSSNAGFVVDDVVVTADTPEPSTFALAGILLIGITQYRRRRA